MYGFPHHQTLAFRMVPRSVRCEPAGMTFAARFRRLAGRPYPGRIELAALAALYAAYEIVRGFGSENWAAARAHTADIVDLESSLGLYVERDVQELAGAITGVPALLGLLYVALHFAGTAAVLIWVHARRPHAFPFLRTTLIVSTALALVGYVLYPAAPPRLADLGFADTVSTHTGLNLSSDLLGSLYNPIAAVPSLHFGYALIVGVAVAQLASRRWVRRLGAAYPAAMLLIIVATGNHFFFDAAAGALVVGAGWLAAAFLRAPAVEPVRLPAPADAWTPHSGQASARAA
jgi:PAP2 superfamily